MELLQSLEKKLLWKYFFELSNIPRPSKHEEKAQQWVIHYAKKWNLPYTQDNFGNILLSVPANTQTLQNAPSIVIQSHLDMVCEKDAHITHNFFEDALTLQTIEYKNTKWITASGTTLGADNGIAVAMAMALADPSCETSHGPLELFFTLDEETGLNGALHMQKDFFSSEYLINIDNAKEGVLCIGCAGGKDFVATIPICKEAIVQEYSHYSLVLEGFSGGHSGMEIYDGRWNALKGIECLLSEFEESFEYQLSFIESGEKRNAIPHFAKVIIHTNKDNLTKIQKISDAYITTFRKSLPTLEKNITTHIETDPSSHTHALSKESLSTILTLIRQCPHGVLLRRGTQSDDSSLSNNLASIRTHENSIVIVNNSRFDSKYGKRYISRIILSIFEKITKNIYTENNYPAWEPEYNTPLQKLFIKSYKKHYNTPPLVSCVHAGLECGFIKSNTSHPLDIIAIGPDIEFLHSPKERLNIESTNKTWTVLRTVIQNIMDVKL